MRRVLLLPLLWLPHVSGAEPANPTDETAQSDLEQARVVNVLSWQQSTMAPVPASAPVSYPLPEYQDPEVFQRVLEYQKRFAAGKPGQTAVSDK